MKGETRAKEVLMHIGAAVFMLAVFIVSGQLLSLI